MTDKQQLDYEWNENVPSHEWDSILAAHNGHPLQSAEWGDTRKITCNMKDHRWMACKNGKPVFMARFEERCYLKFFKIAWAPKGPVVLNKEDEKKIYDEFLLKLRKNGFFLCTTNPHEIINVPENSDLAFYTVLIDLTLSEEKLLGNLHKQCRYDIRRAAKLGVKVEQTKSLDDLNAFNKICDSMSKSKGFSMGNAADLMTQLFNKTNREFVESCLLVAKYENEVCGGAFLIRCGDTAHYIWGAVDRKYSSLCLGEALQWGAIQWTLSTNCKKYDLGGISTTNSSVDKFKKKLGGAMVPYAGFQFHPLYLSRNFILYLMDIYLKLRPHIHKFKKYFKFTVLVYLKRIFRHQTNAENANN